MNSFTFLGLKNPILDFLYVLSSRSLPLYKSLSFKRNMCCESLKETANVVKVTTKMFLHCWKLFINLRKLRLMPGSLNGI